MPLDPTRRAVPLPRLAADPLSRVVVALMLLGMSPGDAVEIRVDAALATTAQPWPKAPSGTATAPRFPFR